MDTPKDDIESNTTQIASGCQILCFTTGRGTPVGAPSAPVIKITGNPFTSDKTQNEIDVNAGTIIQGRESIDVAGVEVFAEPLEVVSGRLTKAELLGYQEFCINRVGPSY